MLQATYPPVIAVIDPTEEQLKGLTARTCRESKTQYIGTVEDMHVETYNRFVGSRTVVLLEVKTNLSISLCSGQHFSMSPATGTVLHTLLLISDFQQSCIHRAHQMLCHHVQYDEQLQVQHLFAYLW